MRARARRRARREPDAARDDARLLRHRRALGLHRRAVRAQARARFREGRPRCPGRELALTFASLRANDLIWQYVVNNYLKGKTPPAVRPALLEQRQHQSARARCTPTTSATCTSRTTCASPGKLTMCGVPVDLRKIDMPGVRARDARGSHRAVADGLRERAAPARQDRSSCSRRAATSPASINPASQEPSQLLGCGGKLLKDPERWLEGARSRSPGAGGRTGARGSRSTAASRVAARRERRGRRATYPANRAAPGRYVKEPAQRGTGSSGQQQQAVVLNQPGGATWHSEWQW